MNSPLETDTPRLLRPGEKPGYGSDLKGDLLKYLRVGIITRVDYEKGLVDLDWFDFIGGRTNIPFSSGFTTNRATARGMPEINSLVLCGFIRQSQNIERPVILEYLDIDFENAINYRLSRNKAPENLKQIQTIREKIGYDSVRKKRKKIYPGELQLESTQGSEITLDDNIYISNSRLNEIEIVSSDQSIRFSTRQEYHNTSANRVWNGMVTREPVNNTNLIQPTILPNGQRVVIVTDSNNPYHMGGKAFTENRTEVYEKTTGQVYVNEVNSGYDVSDTSPYITSLLGTTVGNDKSDVNRYAKVLRPQIFGTPSAIDPKLDELECLPEEYNTLAGSVKLKLHRSGTQLHIDKQGHLFTHFAASTAQHPLGAGRSWEGNFDGSIKWVVGANVQEQQSIILDTKGGIKEVLGYDNINLRSRETITQKGIYTEVLDGDNDGNAWYLKTSGALRQEIDGDIITDVTGDYTITVAGKIQENIMGVKEENYINDKNVVYGGNFKEVTIKDKEVSIGGIRKVTISGVTTPPITPSDPSDSLDVILGSREETYTAGNLKRTLLLGDMTSDITLGNNETNVTTGDIEENITIGDNKESITTGNKEIKITTGDYTLEISTAGKIDVKTNAGKINIDSVTNQVKVNGLLEVEIKSGVKLKNVAPLVDIGQLPTKGGVVTGLPTPSHYDYVTGAPLIGSTTVKATI